MIYIAIIMLVNLLLIAYTEVVRVKLISKCVKDAQWNYNQFEIYSTKCRDRVDSYAVDDALKEFIYNKKPQSKQELGEIVDEYLAKDATLATLKKKADSYLSKCNMLLDIAKEELYMGVTNEDKQ